MTKNYVCRTHFSGIIHHMIFISGTHMQNDHMSNYFFHLFKIFIFQALRWLKGQKMVQNDKKFCPSHSRFQEANMIWLSFVVHYCKMIISLEFFHFFKILIFRVVMSGKGHKWPQMTKILVRCSFYLRNHVSYDLHLWYTCIKG